MSMIKTLKTHKAKRAFDKRAPKLVENSKKTLILHGTKTSDVVNQVLTQIFHLKRDNAIKYSKKNDNIRPKPAVASSSESQAPALGFGFDHVAKKYKVVRVQSDESSGCRACHSRNGMDFVRLLNRGGYYAGPGNHVEFNANPDDHVGFQADPRNLVAFNAHGAGFLAAPEARVRHGAARVALTRAEVCTLGTDSWREVQGCSYPCLHGQSVYANGAVYWLVDCSIREDRILKFDLGSEQFTFTPHRHFGRQINLAELGGCLAVVDLSSRNSVEISVLKDPTGNIWELAYIIGLDMFGQHLMCVHEMKNGILIWLQDNIIFYDKKTFIRRHPKLTGFPTWLDWKICSGYRASLVPLGNSQSTGDDQRDIVHFISGPELDILLLRGGA